MGLGICAYSKIELVEELSVDEANIRGDTPDGLIYLYFLDEFKERADSLKAGFYKVNGTDYRFRAGSYGGYNDWRNILSEVMLGIAPDIVWTNSAKFKGQPFYELIDFADNEGIIGPRTSMKLSLDFETEREKMANRARQRFQFWILGTYDHFHKAFKLASDNGVLKFT
jgi:hypothetical protein